MNTSNARFAHLRMGRLALAVSLAVGLPGGVAWAETLALSRDEAITLAIERDLEIAQSQAQESMLRDTARVSAALPPPTLTVSAANLPLDTLAFDQEPMTQLQVKVSQMFPPGDSRRWRALSQERSADAALLQRELRGAMLQRELRLAWIEGWMAQAAIASLEANRMVFEQALATTRASYGAGIRQSRQREVLAAQAALTRLDERVEKYAMQLDTTREAFAEWLSEEEVSRLDFALDGESRSARPEADLDTAGHPAVRLVEAQRSAAEAERQLAGELNKGSRGISLSYGYREDAENGTDRADFVSLGFTMDLAALRGQANAARLSAANSKLDQADREIELQRVRLERDYRQLQAKVDRLDARRSVYHDKLLPQYRQQAEVTRRAFASDEARFIELQLVLIDLLNAELEALALDADLMKAEADVDYLLITATASGERS